MNKEALIVDEITRLLEEKKIPNGAKLPSEHHLAEKFSVPRMTVRNALIKLEERGMIYSKQGKGRYVKEESLPIQLHLTGKISFTDKMKQLGYDIETQNISCEKLDYDSKVFSYLNAKADDVVYKIARVRRLNGEPIAIHHSYVKEHTFPSIKSHGPQIESMFSYYRKMGYQRFTSSKTLLSIKFPTSKEQNLLSCKSMVPIIVVETGSMDADTNEILEYTRILYRSDRFKYDISKD